jgi:hypothetical protein
VIALQSSVVHEGGFFLAGGTGLAIRLGHRLSEDDAEEFWFRDGHLLLRGNNGTGKSKVLSLTLPFLLVGRMKRVFLVPHP